MNQIIFLNQIIFFFNRIIFFWSKIVINYDGCNKIVLQLSCADPSHPAVDTCKRIFSYPFQKMEVEYLSRSTVANICKSLWCCSFHPLLLRSGIHLNFLDRKVVSLLFSDGFCPNGLSVKIQRHRIHQRKTQKKRKQGPGCFEQQAVFFAAPLG